MDYLISNELVLQIEEFAHRVVDSQPEPALRAQARQIVRALGKLHVPTIVFQEVEDDCE